MILKPKVITVRNKKMGGGTRNICTPVQGKNFSEIKKEIDKIKIENPDFIEWRADLFEKKDLSTKLEVLKYFYEEIPEIPIIYTPFFEDITINEAKKELEEIIELMENVKIDIVNINLVGIEDLTPHIVSEINSRGSYCMLTTRFISDTPNNGVMLSTLKKMEYLGADIVQILVKPDSYSDLLRFLDVSNTYFEADKSVPLIAVAYTSIGLISRILGYAFGTTLTYAYTMFPTLSGQMTMEELNTIYGILDKYLL